MQMSHLTTPDRKGQATRQKCMFKRLTIVSQFAMPLQDTEARTFPVAHQMPLRQERPPGPSKAHV